ncbi:MAG: hypothetical protein A2104_02390 [Candidatus Melainabacteria bacterium GWF2_32_7]|nr:MAG: hypothetical protein A2104_02390 [Candidatus Melainabacteria bacterium GWF2_32_7]
MKTEILELEEVLNKEIEAYSKLEKYILDKKDSLISGDIEKLRNIDYEIEKFNSETGILEGKRAKITSKFGHENLSLREIIKKIEKEDKAEKISGLRIKLKNLAENIQRQNKINNQLIKHSLNILEFSIVSIANALMPEASAYNNFGKINNNQQSKGVSSINHEI